MQILNISGFYKPISIINTVHKKEKELPQREISDYSFAEILGRSQVNFKGHDDFKLNKKDKLFVESTAYNLRLSKDKKEILKNEVINFLKTKELSSISDIDLDDDLYLEGELMQILSDKLQLEDIEVGLLRADLYERIDAKISYVPTDRRFGSDKIVMRPIIKEYGFNSDVFFDIMEDYAVEQSYDSLFDIFKTGNNPANSKMYQDLLKIISISKIDDLQNLIIDFNASADSDDVTKRYQIMYNSDFSQQRLALAAEIKKYFSINDKINNIVKYIKKLDNSKVTPIQVAYEIADEYNLPPGSMDILLDLIYIYSNDGNNEDE